MFGYYGREAVESAALEFLGYPLILVTEPSEVQRLNKFLSS